MFNDDDEIRSALTKMYEYSPLDGFVEISEGLGNMIKSSAYQPSLGLFYVQQHAHEGIPNLVNLRGSIVVKSREIGLHTEDSQDSIKMVRSMKDCGFPIVDDMISDISKSLAIMSSKQKRKGLIGGGLVSGFGTGRMISSWGRTGPRGNVNWEDSSKATIETANGYGNAMVVGEELPVSSCIMIGDEEEEELLVDKLVSDLSRSGKFDESKGVIKKQDLRNG
ncbi:hypothetical protein SSX86_020511 [Deinandra increscens subsp. villosa]|uniref:Uncharacterized protein n=1 Tax=Deinandra increscens subsp. villosa TaxID=3103831 RepID=A0AAP0CT65_9ASTR